MGEKDNYPSNLYLLPVGKKKERKLHVKGNISQRGGKFSSLGGMFLSGRIEEPCHM